MDIFERELANTIVGGNPAKIIREINSSEY